MKVQRKDVLSGLLHPKTSLSCLGSAVGKCLTSFYHIELTYQWGYVLQWSVVDLKVVKVLISGISYFDLRNTRQIKKVIPSN